MVAIPTLTQLYSQTSNEQGWNCWGGGWTPLQFMSTDAHFWVKIGSNFQSLGKISNISTSDPPVVLGQFQLWQWTINKYCPKSFWKSCIAKSPLITMGCPKFNPTTAPSPLMIMTPSNMPIPQPTPLTINSIWIHSAVLPQYTVDRQTDKHVCHISRLCSPDSDTAKKG